MLQLKSSSTTVTLHPKGARLVSCVVDGVETVFGNVVENEVLKGDLYSGVLCGRHAGRITNATFPLDGDTIAVIPNMGIHQLHGGPDSFATRNWDYIRDANRITFMLESPDGDQGFPGSLSVKAVYALDGNTLSLVITARTTKPTVCNLTNHAYWNMAGGGSILGHELMIAAQKFFPLNELLLPLGEIKDVADTRWDFRNARATQHHAAHWMCGPRKAYCKCTQPFTGTAMAPLWGQTARSTKRRPLPSNHRMWLMRRTTQTSRPPSCAPVKFTGTPWSGASADPLAGRQGAQTQSIQADETRRIFLVVSATIIFKGHEVVLVKRLRTLPSTDDHIALVELQAHNPFNMLLAFVDHGLQHFAFR
jgi:galactose mutarotase-like enzyme